MKIFLGALFVAGLITAFVCWLIDKEGCSVILSFERFHSYWKKDPYNWDLRSGWVHYYAHDRRHFANCSICFPFTGWIQYRLWKLFHEKIERDERLRKAQIEFEKFMEDEDGT